MTESNNYAEIVSLLKKELKAREKDLQLAALYGKQLLEEKTEVLNQIEVLKQEKYCLQLNLETQTQTVKTQTSEIELYVNQVNSLEKEKASLEKEVSVLRQRRDNSSKEKHDLEIAIDDLQLENSSLKSQVARLKQEIEAFNNVSILNDTRCDENLPDITEFTSKIKTLEEIVSELQNELDSTKLSEKRWMQSVKDLEEAVSDRDRNLSSEVQRIADLQDTVAELSCEIETLKLGQLDVNRQGNSMFAELDDRRKSVEKVYKELSKKYSDMLTNYEENKKELINCKGQLAILASMTSKKHQEDQIKKLREMLSDALRKKRELNEKLCRAEKALQNDPQVPVKGDQYNYLKILNQQAHEKITKLESELMSERLQAMDFEKRLSSSIQETYACQESLQSLKGENLKLKQEIKDMKAKPDVCMSSKPKVNIEVVPGFESNPECKKLVEMAMKENADPQKTADVIPGELLMSEKGFVQVKPPSVSNKAKLHSFHTLSNSEIRNLNNIPGESSQVISNQKEEVLNRNSKPVDTLENRKSNCAQQ